MGTHWETHRHKNFNPRHGDGGSVGEDGDDERYFSPEALWERPVQGLLGTKSAPARGRAFASTRGGGGLRRTRRMRRRSAYLSDVFE
eukprot:9456635-Pyramimonas_sp.AAC.1